MTFELLSSTHFFFSLSPSPPSPPHSRRRRPNPSPRASHTHTHTQGFPPPSTHSHQSRHSQRHTHTTVRVRQRHPTTICWLVQHYKNRKNIIKKERVDTSPERPKSSHLSHASPLIIIIIIPPQAKIKDHPHTVISPLSIMVTLLEGVPLPLPTASTLYTTSMPSTTLPNTT